LAQDGSVSPGCDPAFVLPDLQFMLEDVETFEDFIEVLAVGGTVVFQCYEDWLTLLIDFAMDEFGGGALPLPIPQPAPEVESDAASEEAGGVTAADAEAALTAAFLGDVEFANEFICPSEHLEEDEGAAFPDDLVVNEVSCERVGDEMICTYSVTSDTLGGELADGLTFDIVDELLCMTVE
jgi:hypothetical protein